MTLILSLLIQTMKQYWYDSRFVSAYAIILQGHIEGAHTLTLIIFEKLDIAHF